MPNSHTPNPDLPPRQRPIRVGFISAKPITNPNYLSGMPYRMSLALAEQGLEIVPLCEQPNYDAPRPIAARIRDRLLAERRRRTPQALTRILDETLPQRTRRALMRRVRQRSTPIQSQLDALLSSPTPPDALFGCCISLPLYALRTTLPITYFSDATSIILRDTYPTHTAHAPSRTQTLLDIERIALDRTAAAIFASPITQHSAIHDLGTPPERTHVVPMGAHLTPDDPSRISAPAPPPTRDNCQLIVIAADPVRKRVDLCVEITNILRARSINATLHVVGPGTPACANNPAINPVGRLKLSDPDDRQTQLALLRDAHLQLLPSLGEAFGIAPCESAHFARPSLVSNAGGLPFVIQHNKTGLVLDLHDTATTWADAIESLIDNPDHYQSMSTAALQRARTELNWTAWGASVAQIIRDTLASAQNLN